MEESLSEKYLEIVAKEKNVKLPEASQILDKCIKSTASLLNLEYSVIYNSVFTEDGMKWFLKKDLKSCSDLTIKECAESADCFALEPYGCISRRIENVDKINEDPDKYIITHLGKTEDLRKLVQIAAYLYYNYDGGGLTDNSFDALEYHLKKRERLLGRVYEKIGAPPVDKIRVNLPYAMPSLNKVKPGTMETANFLSRFNPQNNDFNCCWSLKLDGVSGMVVYKNGKISKIYTRGDGIIGGDVTYLKEYVKTIPDKTSKDYTVRGEFILAKNTWEAKYKESYSNPRSFVSGKINSGFISPSLIDVVFVAYEIMRIGNEKIIPKPSQSFKILIEEEFVVVENGILEFPTVFEVMELYKKKRSESIYSIDGLVLTEDLNKSAALHPSEAVVNPPNTVAFKMILEEQKRHTKIINVEWNISRYGRYVPVAIYDSVYVNGVRMHRATAHNAAHVRDWSMGKGTKVVVVRSGDVIPQIKDVSVDETISPIYPTSYDEGGYEWHWERSDIVLDEIETNREVLIKRSVHFFETVGVPRLRQKTVEKLYDSGMKTPESIVKASIKDLISIKGIGKKTAEFFHSKIREVLSSIPPDRFIVASTTFKSGIGRKLLKTLFRYIPEILNLDQNEIINRLTKTKIPGFGPSRIKNTAEGIPKFREYLDSFAKEDVKRSVEHYINRTKNLKYNKLIEGKKFVLTGFMGKTDYELEDYIYDHRGDFAATVTSDVEAVISSNVMEISKKMIMASEMNIPVLDIREFSERYKIPLKRFEEDLDTSE